MQIPGAARPTAGGGLRLRLAVGVGPAAARRCRCRLSATGAGGSWRPSRPEVRQARYDRFGTIPRERWPRPARATEPAKRSATSCVKTNRHNGLMPLGLTRSNGTHRKVNCAQLRIARYQQQKLSKVTPLRESKLSSEGLFCPNFGRGPYEGSSQSRERASCRGEPATKATPNDGCARRPSSLARSCSGRRVRWLPPNDESLVWRTVGVYRKATRLEESTAILLSAEFSPRSGCPVCRCLY